MWLRGFLRRGRTPENIGFFGFAADPTAGAKKPNKNRTLKAS